MSNACARPLRPRRLRALNEAEFGALLILPPLPSPPYLMRCPARVKMKYAEPIMHSAAHR
jgi:hypothetical protein